MAELDEISHSIGKLDAKVDSIANSLKTFSDNFEKHDTRLKVMEGYKSYLMGIVAVISIGFTILFDFVKTRILGGS
jgi:hypothetical protein